ncbi:hypothetical protein RRG08_047405 [Elysia crispata]|uniref:Uncharacterized protein n=1 Tax=Elysia crispata TaxID=231223 RepID=A0AAE1D4N2_9GAST|nr:hypothetical protein RRG08_047405 [Elysia crispata]
MSISASIHHNGVHDRFLPCARLRPYLHDSQRRHYLHNRLEASFWGARDQQSNTERNNNYYGNDDDDGSANKRAVPRCGLENLLAQQSCVCLLTRYLSLSGTDRYGDNDGDHCLTGYNLPPLVSGYDHTTESSGG